MRQLVLDVFSGISSDELLPMSKRIGFDGFFVGQDAANVTEKVAKLYAMAEQEGLVIETIHSTIPGCTNLWIEGDAGEDYVQVLKNNIDNCAKFSIPILVVHIQVQGGTEISPVLGIKRLEYVVSYAGEKGIKIAFENINAPELLYQVMAHFPEAHVGFCYDSGHEACHTPGVEYLPILGNRLFCTHLHDNDCVGDLHLLPFEGKMDFDRICKQLKEVNYQGNITLELSYTKDYAARMGKEEFLQKALIAANRLQDLID